MLAGDAGEGELEGGAVVEFFGTALRGVDDSSAFVRFEVPLENRDHGLVGRIVDFVETEVDDDGLPFVILTDEVLAAREPEDVGEELVIGWGRA